MSSLFDFNNDRQVTPEEETLAFFLLMEDEEEEVDSSSHCSGCLFTVLSIFGVLIMLLFR